MHGAGRKNRSVFVGTKYLRKAANGRNRPRAAAGVLSRAQSQWSNSCSTATMISWHNIGIRTYGMGVVSLDSLLQGRRKRGNTHTGAVAVRSHWKQSSRQTIRLATNRLSRHEFKNSYLQPSTRHHPIMPSPRMYTPSLNQGGTRIVTFSTTYSESAYPST